MDWDDLRFYLAVIRHKSLAGAAKQLHVTQSTVGRRLASLETRLGVRLVHRTDEGYVPTLAGEAIRQHVERVEAEMHSVERAVGGLDTRLAGTVRVASTALLAGHVLAPCAAALYTRYPEISLELIANSAAPDLARREADVSVQLSRCEQGGMVVRRVGTLAFGLYASLAYLSRHGDPDPDAGCAGHHLVTMVDERELPAQAEWLAEVTGRAQVLLRTNSRETLLWSALHAGGLALLPCFRGDQEPALRRVETVPSAPNAEVWLVVHEEMRHVPRIRAALDCVAETFRRIASTINPHAAAQQEQDG
jgi:DNA-binding transcriptional LysR family regulator